jgi:hypothetical protein
MARASALVVGLCIPIILYAFAQSGEFPFTPAMITVGSGTKVTSERPDDIPRSVADADGRFPSAALDRSNEYDSDRGLHAPIKLSRHERKRPCDKRTGV